MEHETAGDPISGLKWTRKTTEGLAEELKKLSIEVSANTVAKLLKSLDFSLRGNHKKHPANTKVAPKERDQQFIHIRHLREQFSHWQCPIISIDTKKKKMIGNFKNNGLAWSKEPTGVNDHDFKSQSDGTGIPYGIYEILTNEGSVFIGTSYDTPAFAVACLEQWWQRLDKSKYKRNDKLLILADSDGSNGTRPRMWKWALQQKLSNPHRLCLRVAHYPPGTSKWNPIEHRLFSEISKNWAAKPLSRYETMLNYIRTTSTKTGLTVQAHLLEGEYPKNQKVRDADFESLCIKKHKLFPKWNYTISPQ